MLLLHPFSCIPSSTTKFIKKKTNLQNPYSLLISLIAPPYFILCQDFSLHLNSSFFLHSTFNTFSSDDSSPPLKPLNSMAEAWTIYIFIASTLCTSIAQSLWRKWFVLVALGVPENEVNGFEFCCFWHCIWLECIRRKGFLFMRFWFSYYELYWMLNEISNPKAYRDVQFGMYLHAQFYKSVCFRIQSQFDIK